jgi:hypothetical protein
MKRNKLDMRIVLEGELLDGRVQRSMLCNVYHRGEKKPRIGLPGASSPSFAS